jgi:hypothetical protein
LSPGKTAIAGVDLYTNEAIAALVPREGSGLLPEYLLHVLPRIDYAYYTRKATKGRTLNMGTIESIKIPVPSVDVQKKIIAAMQKQAKVIREHEDRIARARQEGDDLIATMAGVRRPDEDERPFQPEWLTTMCKTCGEPLYTVEGGGVTCENGHRAAAS